MSRLLSTLAGAATVYAGVEAGREAEHLKQRRRIAEARQDETYDLERRGKLRSDERSTIEHGDFTRNAADEAGARDVARRAAQEAPAPAVPAAPVAPAPRTLAAAPSEQNGLADAQPVPPAQGGDAEAGAVPVRTLAAAPAADAGAPAAAPEGPGKALWARTAEAQRDYWVKQGKPERAAKVMTDAINTAIAEREATHKYDTLPKIEALRAKGLDNQALESDQKFIDLRKKAAEGDVMTAGLMWGHVLNGNKKAAVDAFNASGVTLPGMQVADIGQNADGTKIMLLDKDGQVAKDKQGRPLVYPRQLLDNLWNQAQTSTVTLNKGQTVVRVQKGPGGAMEAKPIVTAPDPEAENRAARERRVADAAAASATARTDKAWGDAINKARDDSHRYLKDSLGLTANALGQVMNPDNAPLFERAQPIVEEKLQKLRSGGKRIDEVNAAAIAKEALTEARDALKREKAGAGKAGAPAAAKGPTWRDVLK